MVAQGVVRAEISGALADGVVFSEKPNPDQALIQAPAKWKRAFHDWLWSEGLSVDFRGVLLTFLRISDPLGRVWWGQAALAEKVGCSVRTLRRWLHLLVEQRYLRVEPQTFTSLTEEQRALGLPEPERNDAGRAPNVLTLLADGLLACELDMPRRSSTRNSSRKTNAKSDQDKPRPGVARALPRGQIGQGEPRTKALEIPPDKMANDLSGSALLTRKVEGDLEPAPDLSVVVGGESEESADVQRPDEPIRAAEAPTMQEAWKALDTAYNTHYRRTYQTRPTNKFVSHELQEALATCLVESTEAFVACVRERGVDVKNFEVKPCEMLANEALRTWFAKPGGNEFLRRVSHPMHALRQDLPYHLRNAAKAQLELHTPKPEPRRAVEPSTALISCEVDLPDNPVSTKRERALFSGDLRGFVAGGARKIVEVLSLPLVRAGRPRFG